jgi:CPA1 family monovalent cation:H+ antiporter
MMIGSLIVVGFSRRFKLQAEVLVLIVGALLSFLPFLPQLKIDGELFLTIILPPILYSSARKIGVYKFNTLKRPILSMGVLLVIVTALAVAWIAHQMIPFLNWGSCIIIGALVAPTDAVSAIAIGKKLKLNDRTLTIMTGESLINDASALTLYSVGLATLIPTHSYINSVSLLFLFQLGVGLAVGIVVGILTNFIRKSLKDPSLITVFSAVVPYTAYIVADAFEASGVIAVVICGFIVERSAFVSNYAVRIQERNFWMSIDTLFETLVFGYMGLQFRFIIEALGANGIHPVQAFLLSLPILLVVIVLRPIWVFSTTALGTLVDRISRERLLKASKLLYKRFPNREQRMRERAQIILRHDTLKHYKVSSTTIQDQAILSWCGMRGVVSLAIAASVPTTINSAHDTLLTSFILMVGLVVACVTLIVQATTLPWVIRKLSVEDVPHRVWLAKQRAKARQLLDDTAEKVIEDLDPDEMPVPVEQIRLAWDRFRRPLDKDTLPEYEFVVGVISEIIETQRQDIVEATNTGEIDPDVAKEILARLDHRQEAFIS